MNYYSYENGVSRVLPNLGLFCLILDLELIAAKLYHKFIDLALPEKFIIQC